MFHQRDTNPKSRSQRDHRIKALKENNEVVFRPARGYHGLKNTWVSIQRGIELCVEYGLVEKLRPLLDRGSVLQSNKSNPSGEKVSFVRVIDRSCPIMVRKSDWRINCTQLANRASKRGEWEVSRLVCCTTGELLWGGGKVNSEGTSAII